MSKNVTVNQNIPKSFTPSVDRPFEPVGIRDLNAQLYDHNNARLTDAQVQQLINNPPPTPDPNQRINKLSATENAKLQAEYESEKIYNLSLADLAKRTTSTFHDILDDIVTFDPKDGIRGFLQIFIQSDRLMYVGIVIIALTLLIMLFKTRDTATSSLSAGQIVDALLLRTVKN